MSRRNGPKMKCDCGCGREEHFHKLRVLEIPFALDESLRQQRIGRRFYLHPECYAPFINELQAMHMLEQLVRSYIHRGAPWYRKIWAMRRVVRLQFIIHSRLKGIEATRRQSLRSGILFVSPNWLGYYLDRYWRWRNNLAYQRRLKYDAKRGVIAEIPESASHSHVPR